jgi:hypothetical protein
MAAKLHDNLIGCIAQWVFLFISVWNFGENEGEVGVLVWGKGWILSSLLGFLMLFFE